MYHCIKISRIILVFVALILIGSGNAESENITRIVYDNEINVFYIPDGYLESLEPEYEYFTKYQEDDPSTIASMLNNVFSPDEYAVFVQRYAETGVAEARVIYPNLANMDNNLMGLWLSQRKTGDGWIIAHYTYGGSDGTNDMFSEMQVSESTYRMEKGILHMAHSNNVQTLTGEINVLDIDNLSRVYTGQRDDLVITIYAINDGFFAAIEDLALPILNTRLMQLFIDGEFVMNDFSSRAFNDTSLYICPLKAEEVEKIIQGADIAIVNQ